MYEHVRCLFFPLEVHYMIRVGYLSCLQPTQKIRAKAYAKVEHHFICPVENTWKNKLVEGFRIL